MVGLALGLEDGDRFFVGSCVGSEVGANVLLGVIATLCVGCGVGFLDGDAVGGSRMTLDAEAPVVVVLAGRLAWSMW